MLVWVTSASRWPRPWECWAGRPGGRAAPAATGGLGGLGGMLGGGGGGAAAMPGGVAANLGGAGAVGKLAVPPSWIGGAPLAAPHAPLPVSSVSAAPEGAGSGNLLGGMPLAGAGAGGRRRRGSPIRVQADGDVPPAVRGLIID